MTDNKQLVSSVRRVEPNVPVAVSASHYPTTVKEQQKGHFVWSIPLHPMLCHASERIASFGHAVLFMVQATDTPFQ
jgi:hypothetical protein